MKRLIILLMMACGLFGQGQGINTALLTTPAPPGVFNQFVGTTGVTGQNTYYYWVVAVYPIGMAQAQGPVQITNSNGTLDSSNYNTVTWQSPGASVTGYWVIRNTTPTFPGTGIYAVNSSVIASTTFSQTDQSNTLNSFTYTSIPFASSQIQVNNKDFTVPVVQLVNNTDGIVALSSSETAAGINHLNVANGTTTNPVLLRVGSTTDTNTGITVSPKGTGAFKVTQTINTAPGLQVVGVTSAVNGLLITPAVTSSPVVISPSVTGADATAGITIAPATTGTVAIEGGTAGNTVRVLGTTTASGSDILNVLTGNAAGTSIKSMNVLTGTPNTSGNNRYFLGAGVTTKATFNAALTSYQMVNYANAGGSSANALTVVLTDSAGSGVTQAAGLCMYIPLGVSLQAGGNTIALNGAATKNIRSHLNTANNIGTAYASGGIIHVCYDGTQYEDMSQ